MIIIKISSPHIKRIKDVLASGKVDPAKLIVINDYSRYKANSKILYALSILKFSSYWELHSLLDIPYKPQIRTSLNNFIRDGIITNLNKNNINYNIIAEFWKSHYRTSPFTPEFFIINKDWIDAVTALKTHLSRFFSDADIVRISHRKKLYNNYKTIIQNQLNTRQKAIEDSRGVCVECGLIIKEEFKEHKEYYRYGKIFACRNCNMKASDEMKIEWIKES